MFPSIIKGSSETNLKRRLSKSEENWPLASKFEEKITSVTEKSQNFECWDFNVWNLEIDELYILSMFIIQRHNFISLFNIVPDQWCRLMVKVQNMMTKTNNPYHNFYHVMDVMQTCSVLLENYGASLYLDNANKFSLIFSALCHDLEHPGTNNIFQVNTESNLAIRYNDVSVLENHHCSLAFITLREADTNIFGSIPEPTKKQIRKEMISLILNTDMTLHFGLKAELDDLGKRHHLLIESYVPNVSAPVVLNEKDRLILMKSLLHLADISNPAKNWEISKKWSDLVLMEFLSQGDQEKALGLPVSMNCDRNTTYQDELSLGFADFIVSPFFASIINVLPKFHHAMATLESNRTRWHEMLVARLAPEMEQETIRQKLAGFEGRKANSAKNTQNVIDVAIAKLSLPYYVG